MRMMEYVGIRIAYCGGRMALKIRPKFKKNQQSQCHPRVEVTKYSGCQGDKNGAGICYPCPALSRPGLDKGSHKHKALMDSELRSISGAVRRVNRVVFGNLNGKKSGSPEFRFSGTEIAAMLVAWIQSRRRHWERR